MSSETGSQPTEDITSNESTNENSKIDRRHFLKIAGFSALFGVGSFSALHLLKPGALDAISPKVTSNKVQLSIVIDTKKFNKPEDFDRVIKACHLPHNVPEIRHADGTYHLDHIKWIWKDKYHHVFEGAGHNYLDEDTEKREYLVLCNHCSHPPCVRVCPTQATFKRVDKDGVVMMDEHRCIGCRFCIAACPYGARSFNFRDPRPYIVEQNASYPTRTIGVVEKCTFCSEIIADGTLPYCVEACKDVKGMYFGNINDANSEVRKILRKRQSIVRKPELGTQPNVFYLI